MGVIVDNPKKYRKRDECANPPDAGFESSYQKKNDGPENIKLLFYGKRPEMKKKGRW
ncbi:MAG TPA: hypothetical protein VG890_15220 [Puia sp.]|nr:hypothetical protein [Puia sp.]